MSIGRLYHLRKIPAALVEGGVSADFTTITGSSATYHTISGSTITMNLATSNRLVTNQISGSTSTFNTVVGHSFSGSSAVFHRVSGSTGTYSLIDSDRGRVADISGSSLAYNSISGSAIVAHSATTTKFSAGTVSGSIINVQRLNIFGEISGSGENTLIKKQHLHKDIIQNNSDSHGGLSFDSGRLSVGWRKKIYVRSDGSNISGSVPTKGMFATDAMTTPYTTASLGSKPMSGSLMVYLNGVLLHGDHPGENPDGPTSTDYRVNTGSANAHVVLLHEDLSLDSDDILTITFLSGSGVNS